MKITLKKSFLKDIEKVTSPQKNLVKLFLEEVYTKPSDFENRYNIKKLKGIKGNFFRIRFGEYRLGYEKRENEIIVYRILHRKAIYRHFP